MSVVSVLAAGQTPAPTPPFLRHIPEFRRRYEKKPVDNKPQFDVEPGVACGGCAEP